MLYVQKFYFGWVIVGEVCFGRIYRLDVVVVNKVLVMFDGRNILVILCLNNIIVKEILFK